MSRNLELAERHVAEGIARMKRQVQLVKRLCPGTPSAIIAYQTLLICSETLELMKQHLEYERKVAERHRNAPSKIPA